MRPRESNISFLHTPSVQTAPVVSAVNYKHRSGRISLHFRVAYELPDLTSVSAFRGDKGIREVTQRVSPTLSCADILTKAKAETDLKNFLGDIRTEKGMVVKG